MTHSTLDPVAHHADLGARYRAVRNQTEWLAEPLGPEDQTVQSMTDASPVKWHRAHTTWFFETFLLLPCSADYQPLDDRYTYLFNSYYNAVGEQFPRHRRGMVTRPTVADVTAYRAHVDAHMERLLSGAAPRKADVDPAVVEIGLQHEQQHQELLVTDVKHMLSMSPLHPVYRERQDGGSAAGAVPAMRWVGVEEGVYEVGHAGQGFAYDNEGPRHKVYVPACEIATRPVTNAEYQAFMDDGGYRRADLWLSDGWASVKAEGWRAPMYWEEDEHGWKQFTLSGLRGVVPDEPVTHVSLYEADAFARWAGGRLPTEFQWEVAARAHPVEGRFVEAGRFHPAPAPDASGLVQLYGDVWQWTASPYVGYPGLVVSAGALGEYNAKFMANQMVLRGASCATPASHPRLTYRNFFGPASRWQFSGIRLAR